MKVGIIGYGVVGKAASNTLKSKYELVIYDKFMNLASFSDLKDCSFIFVMVPTPFDCLANSVDDSAVSESLENLEKIDFSGIVILKSTLPPGSCDNYNDKYNLQIVFNPEFLRESTTPNEDFANQNVIVIGTPEEKLFLDVKSMFQEVLLPNAKYWHTSLKEAEMIKSAQNTMLASRVALANMIFDACSDNNIDYEKVRDIAFVNFEILGPHMTLVPGPDGKRGFGGKCLPKDIRALSTVYSSELLETIISYNDSLRNDLDKFLMNYSK